jgi:hypothetical protein
MNSITITTAMEFSALFDGHSGQFLQTFDGKLKYVRAFACYASYFGHTSTHTE